MVWQLAVFCPPLYLQKGCNIGNAQAYLGAESVGVIQFLSFN